MLSIDGSIKVSEGSTIVLCLDDAVKALKIQQQWFTNVKENSQHNLPCWWLGSECSHLKAKKGCVLPLQASSFHTV
jgi:hypothetical protein